MKFSLRPYPSVPADPKLGSMANVFMGLSLFILSIPVYIVITAWSRLSTVERIVDLIVVCLGVYLLGFSYWLWRMARTPPPPKRFP